MALSNETSGTGDRPAERNVWQAIRRGFLLRCPSCGIGKLTPKYLKITDACAECSEEMRHHKADDAPAYFTILVVGHIIIPLVLWSEVTYKPSLAVHYAVWPALTIALTLLLLPRIKGALVGLQWANRMHGFNMDAPDEDEAAKHGTGH